jgi:membrane protease YdiL (CAAX protease family)
LALVVTCFGWLIFLLGTALLVGLSLRALGYRRQNLPNLAAASTSFFAVQGYAATFYLVGLLVVRFLAKRRGYELFACYFPAIGLRPVLLAGLIGFGTAGVYLIVILVLAWTSVLHFHPTIATAAVLHQRLGRFAISGLVYIIIAPIAEEIYFRGLLLDSLRQRFFPLLSVLITAAVFSLVHVQFLLHPGIVGWLATAALVIMGIFNALWAQRTHSLRGPVAAHASYNAILILFIFFVQ